MRLMSKVDRLIIFFVPPEKIVNGGVMSIFSICKESRRFKNLHHAEVVLATYPGTKSYKKNDLFTNDETILDFEDIVKQGSPSFLELHIPEYASYNVFLGLKKYAKYIAGVKELRVNILNQNILLMQPPHEIANWFSLTPYVSQTTAHAKYATQELANDYNIPTHHLSTFVDASQYQWAPFEKKQKIVALSPDEAEARPKVVAALKKYMPDFKLITIQNMTFEEYKKTIGTAMFTITFGEGYDGYYVEPFLSGGITLAVYNDEFFPDPSFKKYRNVYSNYEDMIKDVATGLSDMTSKTTYEKIVKANFDKTVELYHFSKYLGKIEQFYKGDFAYYPQKGSAETLIQKIMLAQQELLEEKNTRIKDMEADHERQNEVIAEKDRAIVSRDAHIRDMEQSLSWRVTQPLRKTSARVRKSS